MGFLLQNLEFYDSKGVRQAATLDSSNVWNFELSFDSTSTDLFSTQQIHVMEKAVNILNNESNPTLTYPKSIDSENLVFRFKDRDYENFFLYRIKYSSNIADYYVEATTRNQNLDLQTKEFSDQKRASSSNTFVSGDVTLAENELYPSVSKVANSVIVATESTQEVSTPGEVANVSTSYINSSNVREIYQYDTDIDAPTVNLGFLSSTKGEFKETLEVYLANSSTETLIANISLFAEAEAQDERFVTILENFGQRLTEEDSLAFRDTDVNEDLIDHQVVNKKNKEMILEFKNLIPFIGSYKGLVNALKFYGYGDLKLKEWWLNSETEKIFQYNVNTETYKTERLKEQDFFENKNLKRTGKFSLYYNINDLTGESDSNGIPELENVFEYSQEEVLIKLYGLKELLKKKYLPLSTRIMDITGEGFTFNRISTTAWNTPITIQEVNNFDINADVEAIPQLSTLSNTFISGYEANLKLDTLNGILDKRVSSLFPRRLDHSNNFSKLYDSPKRESYTTVNLINKDFLLTWEKSNFPWEDADDIKWDDVDGYPFYEMSWIVTKNDGTPFYQKFTGNIAEMSSVSVNVTASGDYDVTLYMRDVYNNVFINRYENLFSVEVPEPRFGVVYNHIKQIDTWEDASEQLINWSDAWFTWGTKLLSEQTWEDSSVTWDSLDPNKYLKQGLLKGQKRFNLDSLDRDGQTVTLSGISDSDLEMIVNQTFLTLIEDRVLPFIKPVNISSADNVANTLTIDSSGPEVGDIVEVFQQKNFTSFTLTDKQLVVSEAINLKNGVKVHLTNSSEDVVLIPEDFSIDDRTGTTTINLLDEESVLFGKTFTEINICYDFRSYDVIDKTGTNTSSTITIFSTVEENVDVIEEILQSNTMGVWWNLLSGKYSVPIGNITTTNVTAGKRDILINLIDSERELFRVSRNFRVIFAEYDINKAEGKATKTELTWDDLGDSSWVESDHLNWDVCELVPSLLTGFIINDVSGGGRIKINDSEHFQFTSHCTGNITLAVSELTNSEITEFTKYNYHSIDANTIHATSKTWGEDTLAIIEYGGGLGIESAVNPRYASNYPLPNVTKQEPNYEEGTRNNRLLSNRLIRNWDYIEEDVEIERDKSDPDLYFEDDIIETFKQNLAYTTNGNFRWENTMMSEDSINIPRNTICYFYGDISEEIIGKSSYNWKIYDDSNDDVLVEIEGSHISYLFNDKGNYSVELEITDRYGNKSNLRKSGMVNTF